MKINEKLYSAGTIIIKSDTENITVNLVYIPKIGGTVTLDGQPLDKCNLSFYNKDNYYKTSVSDGKFEINALPGKYTVIGNNSAVATVELKESGQNKINLSKEAGRSRVRIIRTNN